MCFFKKKKKSRSFFNDKSLKMLIWCWQFKINQSYDNYSSFLTLLDGIKSPVYRVIPSKRTLVTLNSKTFVPLLHNKATFEHVEVEFRFGISTTTEYCLPEEKITLIKCRIFRKITWGIKQLKKRTYYRISC